MMTILSTPPENAEKSTPAAELKDELRREVDVIVSDEERETREVMEAIEKAIKCLSDLKKNSMPSGLDNQRVPVEFRCPISKQLMRDPVILSSGVTYDRPFILNWLKDGKRTCPQTQQVLSHTDLIPNQLVRDLIAQWCKDHGQEPPTPLEDADVAAVLTEADRAQLTTLLKRMASSLPDQKDAAKQIRLMTKRNPSFRSIFCDTQDAVPQLIRPLTVSRGKVDAHPDLQEDIITTLFNLSINEDNKKPLAEDPRVIPLLNESLKCGTINTRSNAAAALFVLSSLDCNKELIGKSGALKPLLDLVEGGHPSARKDAAQAIFNLCLTMENRGRAAREGAVRVIMKKIVEGTCVDEMLSILALLTSNPMAIEELVNLGIVGYLLGIIRESTCERNKENCAAMLYDIIRYNESTEREISKEERLHNSILKLSDNGTSRARRKAYGILAMLSPTKSRRDF